MKKAPSGPTTAPPEETPRERSETPGKTPLVEAARPESTTGRSALPEVSSPESRAGRSALPEISSSELRTERSASEVALVKTAFSRSASASLWTEARRWAERAEERGESELEFERPENSASEEGKRALPPRRSRTFRADEPSRRFDDSSDA